MRSQVFARTANEANYQSNAIFLGGASRHCAPSSASDVGRFGGIDKYRLCESGGSRSRFRGGISNGLMALLTAVLFNVDLCIGESAD